MRFIIDEYGESILSYILVGIILLITVFVFPQIKDYIPFFLESIIGG